jgi:hypothetical protein
MEIPKTGKITANDTINGMLSSLELTSLGLVFYPITVIGASV